MDDKPMTTDDVRNMLKEQRAAAAPVPVEPAKDAPPVMTVDDVKRMLKGLPPLTEEEKAAAMAAPMAGDPEKALEAETGKDFQKTSDDPIVFSETDKPAPGKSAGSRDRRVVPREDHST